MHEYSKLTKMGGRQNYVAFFEGLGGPENLEIALGKIGETISAPVFLMWVDRTLIYSNSAARKMLDGRFCLKIDGERLIATDSSWKDHFRMAIEKVTHAESEQSESISLPSNAEGASAVLHLALADLDEEGSKADRRSALFGIMSCAGALEPKDLLLTRRTFGFSETEAEIAARILAGSSPRQIAKSRKCSEHTVRWHIKNIHSKTGTRRLTDLVLRIQAARSPF